MNIEDLKSELSNLGHCFDEQSANAVRKRIAYHIPELIAMNTALEAAVDRLTNSLGQQVEFNRNLKHRVNDSAR